NRVTCPHFSREDQLLVSAGSEVFLWAGILPFATLACTWARGEMYTTAIEMLSLQSEATPSNGVTASKAALRPNFFGDIEESRLIGLFRDDLTDGARLALQSFIVQEFDLKQLEVLRGAAEASAIVERHECLNTQVDLLCLDLAVLRECESALVARLLK